MTNPDHRNETLYASVYSFFHRVEAASKRNSQDMVTSTERAAEALVGALNHQEPSWTESERTTFSELKQDHRPRPVRVVGRVVEALEPQILSVRFPDRVVRQVHTMQVTLRDRREEAMVALDVSGQPLVARLLEAARAGQIVELLGMALALPPGEAVLWGLPGGARRDFYFFVTDVRETSSHLDRLGATDEERTRALALIGEQPRTGRGFVDDIRDEIVARVGIAGAATFPLLVKLIEFTVLQALSCGTVGNASGRLHLLVVGPPAQGKKLVGVAGRVTSPAWAELSAAKATPAGLIGASRVTGKGWKSDPGLLVRAAHGVAVLQDAHGLTNAQLKRLAPILQELIEDGAVRDASAGGRIWNAPVSLIIDLNRTAQVGTSGKEAAILGIRPLLSRIDLLVEIPEDADRAWAVSSEMYKGLAKPAGGPLEDEAWVRMVQLLVAALRDRHPNIDLSPVTSQMAAIHAELAATYGKRAGDTGDIPARLTITFARLVTALARGGDRDVANAEDVERAAEFLRMKLDFLHRKVDLGGVSECPDVQARVPWVRRQVEAGPVSVSELVTRRRHATGEAITERTFRRDLEELGARKAGGGRYHFAGGEPGGHSDKRTVDADDRGDGPTGSAG